MDRSDVTAEQRNPPGDGYRRYGTGRTLYEGGMLHEQAHRKPLGRVLVDLGKQRGHGRSIQDVHGLYAIPQRRLGAVTHLKSSRLLPIS